MKDGSIDVQSLKEEYGDPNEVYVVGWGDECLRVWRGVIDGKLDERGEV